MGDNTGENYDNLWKQGWVWLRNVINNVKILSGDDDCYVSGHNQDG